MSNHYIYDYYNLEELFSEEERMFRNTVRDFVDQEVLPIIEHHYREGIFPMHLIPKMADIGLFGVTLSAEYGGHQANYTSYGLAMLELERGDSAIRSFASVQNSLVIYPISQYGKEEIKQKWLPKLVSGEAIGCFGLTEPDYGSNPGALITTANPIDGGYRLNGTKMWITNGNIADVAVIWAKLNGVINGFLVEKSMNGFKAIEMKRKHSLRASVTSELILEDVEVPEENHFTVQGLKGPLSCLTQARYGIAWGAIGAAIAVFESSVNYSKTRIQFGKPIGAFQITQEKLAWMLTEITKAQLLAYRLGRLKDEDKDRFQQVSLAKRNNVNMALECARLAREIHGANGILDEYPIMRHMANLESVKTYEGTHEIHTLILGEDITGFNAFI